MGLVTLTFDHLILKLVRESLQRWGIFSPNLDTLGLWVLELYSLCTRRTDGQTDGRTDERNAYFPFRTGGGIIMLGTVYQKCKVQLLRSFMRNVKVQIFKMFY